MQAAVHLCDYVHLYRLQCTLPDCNVLPSLVENTMTVNTIALQVREQCQQQLELLHANVEEVQQAQQALAASSGVGRGSTDELDLDARIEALGQDLDDVRGITHRLERYVEQMLRQMLGSLNAGEHHMWILPVTIKFITAFSNLL